MPKYATQKAIVKDLIEIADIPTDSLAHMLDVHWAAARTIQELLSMDQPLGMEIRMLALERAMREERNLFK
jgi:hypothetical protein